MIPELGQLSLALAFTLALIQFIFPLYGSFNPTSHWIILSRPLAFGQSLFLILAFTSLTWSFITNDFSVQYVAQNANSNLPIIYKISAVWGAHEGSMLLWTLLLSIWSAAIATFNTKLSPINAARMLSVLSFVIAGFLLFIIFTSNPFTRIFPIPIEGRDLNPLLQDLGLALHPPMLYMGYVGLSVAWSAAIAAMLDGKLDIEWVHWIRPWTLIAWMFLTLGITLGSWWAYYELGWGGWWFWDPVENSSLMPWLISTALIHSLIVTEKRGAFKNWTILLSLSAFSFSLLGTFLVRSGILTSVHAFATDPTRGMFILIFLSLIIGTSLALYAWRTNDITLGESFDLMSRETFLLGGNLIFTMFTAVVLFGTLAPLIYEAMNWGKISVGFPWFNTMFVNLTPILAVIMGLAPMINWKYTSLQELIHKTGFSLIASLIVGIVTWLYTSLYVALGLCLATWLSLTHITLLFIRYKNKTLITILTDLFNHKRSFLGFLLAHLGIAIFIVGITIVSHYSLEHDIRMKPNDNYELGGYKFVFNGINRYNSSNYQAEQGSFKLLLNNKEITTLLPEKRLYQDGGRAMTEAAIYPTLTRDFYISLGEAIENTNAWSVRIHIKPYVRWIWLGGFFVAIGGLFAASDKKYRARS
jgi:cytochrome c-type biogenesis protein CcmF